VITGFNTDIKHNEKVYHVQTEDKGVQNPYIESLVYVGGEILASKKTSYAEQLKSGVDEKWIGNLMEQQHRTMIAAVKRGRFDGPADTTKNAAPRPGATLAQDTPAPSAPPAAAGASPPLDDRTLDQVIIDYLASEAESEHLELSLLSSVEFYSGDLEELVDVKLAPRYRNIWLVGGAMLCQRFLELGLVDEIRLTIAPVLLGEGLRLFGGLLKEKKWNLKNVVAYKNGFVELSYSASSTSTC